MASRTFASAAVRSVAPGRAPFAQLGVPPALRDRIFRALLGVALWGAAALPSLAGVQRCTIALVFHRPCPGCGMTRALQLFLVGNVSASLRMHPLAMPTVVAAGAFALSTVWATFVFGMPVVHKSLFGRIALGSLALVYVGNVALWGLRWLGYFGGPVPV